MNAPRLSGILLHPTSLPGRATVGLAAPHPSQKIARRHVTERGADSTT